MKAVTCLALFSGGLDSILACRMLMAQGIQVIGLKYITPFFDQKLLARQQEYQQEIKEKYGIPVELVDLSDGYIDLLRRPPHGFGKHFNPCIDCKILMLRHARGRLAHFRASFLISGEVLGQRPMSQRRDTLRIIERDSGCDDILLRPLCAQRLNPTLPERQGLVDREQLGGITGRGRKPQMALAARFGITDYPNPAGGCVLTDPHLGERIRRFYQGLFNLRQSDFRISDFNLLLVGRQFRLPDGTWVVLGRNRQENRRIRQLAEPGDWLLKMTERPGPTGLVRRARETVATAQRQAVLQRAAGLVVRYGRQLEGRRPPAAVVVEGIQERRILPQVSPLEDAVFQDWLV